MIKFINGNVHWIWHPSGQYRKDLTDCRTVFFDRAHTPSCCCYNVVTTLAGDENNNYAGTVIKLYGGQNRVCVWKLTGNTDSDGNLEGRWPD